MLITVHHLYKIFTQATIKSYIPLGVGKHTKSCVVLHFTLIWHSRSHLPKKLDYLNKIAPLTGQIKYWTYPLKINNFTTSKHSHVSVYPEAIDWNFGAVCSDFKLGEGIWREPSGQPNLKVHSEIWPLGALSPDTLTEFKI